MTNSYSEEIRTIVENIRPDMEALADFIFLGKGGDIDKLRNHFIRCYEGLLQGLELYKNFFPNEDMEEPDTFCAIEDIEGIEGFYAHLKAEDFQPMPFDVPNYQQYTLAINQQFIALQQKIDTI